MNTKPLTLENLPAIEQRLKEAKANGFTTCRTNVTAAEMFQGGVIHFELLDALKSLYLKYGRKMCALYYCNIAPQSYWVNLLEPNVPEFADALYAEWNAEKTPNRSWKRPEGLPQELEQPVIDTFAIIARELQAEYNQLENEPGDTVNKDRDVWADSTPGYINPRFRPFLNRLADAFNGLTIVSTAWETEDEPTYAMQIDSGEGYWLRKCHRYGQNMYFVKWQPGDNQYTVAVRFWAKVKECNPYKMPTAVTEYNIPGVPADKEMATLIEIKKQKPTSVSFCCPYFWSEA